MNSEKQHKPVANPAEEADVEAALQHFRSSVHSWSEQEFARPRAVRHSRWGRIGLTLANPALAWTMAAVLVAGSAGVPVVVHRQRQAEVARLASMEREKQRAAQEAERQTAASIDDESLLSGIDSDIAQDAPDAMQPLASLMSEPGNSTSGTR